MNPVESTEDADSGNGSLVEVVGAYQVGPDYDEFKFSNDASQYLLLNLWVFWFEIRKTTMFFKEIFVCHFKVHQWLL